MEFARKQLEKYGWSDGKGLGKNENGISEALKPKLKRSVAGIGYDAAADFTEHWWSTLYDKAASNIQVEEKNGKTKKMKRKDDKEFEITNSTWRLKKKNNDTDTEEYSDFFVRTAVLGSGGSETVKIRDSDSEDGSESGNKDAMKITDEELFAACQGRTAHKGARHGLRALGKLARIEQQEQLLLQQTKYNSFLNKKNNTPSDLQIVEDTNLNDEMNSIKTKRKKKKRCNSCNNINVNTDSISELVEASNIETTNEDFKSKSKKSKRKEHDNCDNEEFKQENILKVKKKRKHNKDSALEEESMESEIQETQSDSVLKKKKKNK